MARVLLLEKDPINAWELQGELVLGSEHEVVVEEDWRTALERALSEPFDVVLAEWGHVDGGWFCEKLRQHRPGRRLPVILVGPDQDMRDPEELEHLLRVRYGCHDFVQRPLDFEHLRALIDLYTCVKRVKTQMNEERSERDA